FDDMSGANWTVYRGSTTGPDSLSNPTAAVEASNGQIYIGDQGNRRLIRIDDISGANPVVLTGSALGIGELSALDVRTTPDGHVYLAGAASGRVDRITDVSVAGR